MHVKRYLLARAAFSSYCSSYRNLAEGKLLSTEFGDSRPIAKILIVAAKLKTTGLLYNLA